jgi:hypothetical protein
MIAGRPSRHVADASIVQRRGSAWLVTENGYLPVDAVDEARRLHEQSAAVIRLANAVVAQAQAIRAESRRVRRVGAAWRTARAAGIFIH